MLPVIDRSKSNIPLTSDEKDEINRFFKSVVNEMKKHGLPDVGLLKKAFNLALDKHGDTRRKTGEPYILHPLHVAKILADCGHESDMVASAILHDLIEDCGVSKNDLEKIFGITIADIVDTVTKVDAMLAPDETMSKLDLDDLSDVKFLTECARVRKAVYVKCADRIHNLSTISVFPEYKQKEKAYKTRNIIIPAAKKLHIHNFVGILETLCLKIEDPHKYHDICDTYERILNENRDTFFGPAGLVHETKRMIMEDRFLGGQVTDVIFSKRTADSISSNLSEKMHNIHDIKTLFTKYTIPLFDVFFIVSDFYPEKPEDVFFALYDKLHNSLYRFTVTRYHQDDYESYYLLRDRFGNMYRLFIQSEKEHLEFTHGLLVSATINDSHAGIINIGDPEGHEEKMITVFKKDQAPMLIPSGSTVLDFAFLIDPNIGICAKYAHLNGSKARTPIYTRLKAGDWVEVVSDHNKYDQLNDSPHATVRWFEYLHSREAIKSLSRWLEKHMDSAIPSMLVYDAEDHEYEIDMAATVLDFAFLMDEKIGLHVKKAYLNQSKTPVELDTTLRYWDKVRFEYDLEDTETPVFTWLGLVKTKYAKDRLIAYFNKKYCA